ncbi:MAG: hypothetical protein AB2L20_17015 [Mangrovibacterium sp.]
MTGFKFTEDPEQTRMQKLTNARGKCVITIKESKTNVNRIEDKEDTMTKNTSLFFQGKLENWYSESMAIA